MINKTLHSFIFAIRGIATVWKEENNFKIQTILAFLVAGFMYYFKFTLVESVLVVLAMLVVLVSEIINTAIEDLCNKIEPNQDPVIGKVKDISSGFVLLSSIGAIVIGILVFLNHF